MEFLVDGLKGEWLEGRKIWGIESTKEHSFSHVYLQAVAAD